MARNDGIDRTSVRNLAVSDKAVGNTQQHNEREKDSYRNPDIIPQRTAWNIHFKKPTASYTDLFSQLETAGTISTRGLKPEALRDDGSYVSPYSAIDPADSTDENQEATEEAGKDSEYNTYGDEVTLIPDTASYDWGDLSDINARITALEQKYGFSIYFGPEVPKRIDYYDIHQFKNKDKLSIALDSLEEILDCFPDDFFTQLCYGDIRGMRIYLCGDISSGHSDMINEPSGFVNIINNHNVIVLNCNYSWDFSYTVGHEISHLIDQRLTFIHTYDEKSEFSEGKWNSFNPDSFSYDDSYANYNPDDPSNHISGYFIDSYGMTFATEDRSEIFGTAIDDYINGIYDDARFTDDSPIRNKLDYYSRCIRDGFDTKDWPDTMAWESVLTDTGARAD